MVTAVGSARADRPEALDPELLALCRSPDSQARRYCLHAIARRGDPLGEARQTVADMAANDPALREEADATLAQLYRASPPARVGPPAGSASSAGDPTRTVYAPTAFTRPAGTASFNAFELGTYTFDYGVTDHLTMGIQTTIPVGAFVIGPTLRAGMAIDGGAVGVYANALLVAPFSGGTTVLLAGGGPVLTLGSVDSYVNFGVLGYAVKGGGDTFGALVPHVGGSLRISPRARIGAEVYVPGIYGNGINESGFGKVALVLWGVRIFNDSLWGDIALADPICSGCGEIYSVIPLGIPFLNFGAAW
jgi:hypothetical protein